MKHFSRLIYPLAIALGIVPVGAWARDVKVQVDARSGPWQPAANNKMPFGNDPTPPTVVKLPDLPSAKVAIFADGTTVAGGNGAVGPGGVESKAVDDTKGRGKVYPSLYVPKVLYPVNLHALIAVFLDDKGVVVGRPFPVGDGVRVTIPDGATALGLGFNDVSFAGNTGTLAVTVGLPDD